MIDGEMVRYALLADYTVYSRRRKIIFAITDPTSKRHIAEMSMEGCRKARAIRAGRP